MLRVANIVLSVGLLMACCQRITRDWPLWSRRERVVRAHLIAYLFVIAYVRPRVQMATTGGNTVVGAKGRATGLKVEVGTTATDYGDGTREGWAWLGNAHASASKKVWVTQTDLDAIGLPEDYQPTDLTPAYTHATRTSHEVRRDALKRAKGGVVGTNGKPVIAFRIDHGVQEWLDTIWPLFKARRLTASLGVVPDSLDDGSYEPTTYTWENLRKASTAGFEIWSHSKSHVDPFIEGSTIYQEVVGSADSIESHDIRVHGWQQPGISSLSQPGYAANWEAEGYDWSALYPQLVLGRYPLVEMGGNGLGNKMRWLPTGPGYDMPHYTIESFNAATVNAYIDKAVALGMSLQLMHHPRFVIAGSSVMTLADLTAVLDHVAALRDAGTIEVLTASALAFADPTTSRRLDVARNGNFAGGFTDWTNGGGVTLTDDGAKKWATFPSGVAGATNTINQLLDDGIIRSIGLQGTVMEVTATVKAEGAVDAVPLRFEIRDASSTTRLSEIVTFSVNRGAPQTIRLPFALSPTTTTLSLILTRTAGGTGSSVSATDIMIRPA